VFKKLIHLRSSKYCPAGPEVADSKKVSTGTTQRFTSSHPKHQWLGHIHEPDDAEHGIVKVLDKPAVPSRVLKTRSLQSERKSKEHTSAKARRIPPSRKKVHMFSDRFC